jgi:hypothetical protein
VERIIPFEFERTKWFVSRRGKWGMFVHVSREADTHVNLEVDFAVNQSMVTPRRFTIAIEEGVSLPVGEVYCDNDEELVIWWDASTEAAADIGFEYREGVEFNDVTEDGDPTAG